MFTIIVIFRHQLAFTVNSLLLLKQLIKCICSLSLICSLFATLPAGKQNHYMTQGLWVIIGLLAFLLLEKMFPDQDSPENSTSVSDLNFNSAVSISAEMLRFQKNMLSAAHTHVNTSLHIFIFSLVCLVQKAFVFSQHNSASFFSITETSHDTFTNSLTFWEICTSAFLFSEREIAIYPFCELFDQIRGRYCTETIIHIQIHIYSQFRSIISPWRVREEPPQPQKEQAKSTQKANDANSITVLSEMDFYVFALICSFVRICILDRVIVASFPALYLTG